MNALPKTPFHQKPTSTVQQPEFCLHLVRANYKFSNFRAFPKYPGLILSTHMTVCDYVHAVLGDLMPSSSFQGLQTLTWGTDIHEDKAPRHIIFQNKFLKFYSLGISKRCISVFGTDPCESAVPCFVKELPICVKRTSKKLILSESNY